MGSVVALQLGLHVSDRWGGRIFPGRICGQRTTTLALDCVTPSRLEDRRILGVSGDRGSRGKPSVVHSHPTQVFRPLLARLLVADLELVE